MLWGALAPILYVETRCTAPLPGLDGGAAFRSSMPGAEGRRGEARTWLTYPEWYIVYSAESYGRYLAAGRRPSGYSYARDISGFWSGLCAVNRASAPAGGAGDAKIMLYTIGLSFSAEMIVKGLYENSFGRLFEWIGGWQSEDDRYNAAAWASYGRFMHQIALVSLPVRPGAVRPVAHERRERPRPPLGAALRAQPRIWRQGRLCGLDRLGLGCRIGP